MNSQYFKLPFTTDIGGILGFAVSVWLVMWIGHKVPVVKGLIRGS